MAEINNETHEIKEHKQVEFLMQFSASTTECCVCLVDIVGSTDTMMSLDHPQASRYYEIFLNKMADIVKKFGGVVVKGLARFGSVQRNSTKPGNCLHHGRMAKYVDASPCMPRRAPCMPRRATTPQ